MELITERDKIRTVAQRWRLQNKDTLNTNLLEIAIKLDNLNVETATVEDVDSIIGNPTWCNITCSHCGVTTKAAVIVQSLSGIYVTLCATCIGTAHMIIAKSAENNIRNYKIYKEREIEGRTLQAISEKYGISIEMVRQISAKEFKKQARLQRTEEEMTKYNNYYPDEYLIEDLPVSRRTHNCLVGWAGLETVGQLRDKKIHEILRIKNFGYKSLIPLIGVIWNTYDLVEAAGKIRERNEENKNNDVEI